MNDIRIKHKEGKTIDKVAAWDVDTGEMFIDCDGDIYVRTMEGCIMFEEREMTPFSDRDMQNLPENPWFKKVRVIEGTVKVRVKAYSC